VKSATGEHRSQGQGSRHWWRGLSQLRARRQFVITLVVSSVLTLLLLLGGTYVALRAQTLAQAQARLTREAAMASMLLARGAQPLAQPADGVATLPDRISGMTGDEAALYQFSQQTLVAVSAHGLDVVGSPLPQAAQPAVVGSCGPLAPASCHHAYSGVVRAGAAEYEATYAPVFDADGGFAGAIMVATPLADTLAGVNQTMWMLGLLGACLTLIVIAVGVSVFNRSTGQTLDFLQTRLRAVASSAALMEHAAHATVLASKRQERLARQIGEGAHGLNTLVSSVNQGYPALQESAGAIWAEVSQPGASVDPLLTMRLARETVLMATRIGSGIEDARVYCDHILRLMNHVVAHGRATANDGQETQRAARELRAAIESVETILGGRMIRRDEALSPLPLTRHTASVPYEPVARPQTPVWGSSGAWDVGAMPPLPTTERLSAPQVAPHVVNGEVRVITLDEPTAPTGAPLAPARYGDLSFPKLMKDAATHALAEAERAADALSTDAAAD
jgi:hypothetical protein